MKRLTIYRRCPCGETAHDYSGAVNSAGKLIYRCRNCRKDRTSNDARSLRLEAALKEREHA